MYLFVCLFELSSTKQAYKIETLNRSFLFRSFVVVLEQLISFVCVTCLKSLMFSNPIHLLQHFIAVIYYSTLS